MLIPCCIHGGKYINKDGTVDFKAYNEVLKESFKNFIESTDELINNKKINRLKLYLFEINYNNICLNTIHYKND